MSRKKFPGEVGSTVMVESVLPLSTIDSVVTLGSTVSIESRGTTRATRVRAEIKNAARNYTAIVEVDDAAERIDISFNNETYTIFKDGTILHT